MSLVGLFEHEIAPPDPIFGDKSCPEEAIPDNPTNPVVTENSTLITPVSPSTLKK